MNLIPILKTSILSLFIISQYAHAGTGIPVFNQMRAFAYLEKQCAFGPRNPGSEGYQKCLAFLIHELEKSTNTVLQQPFLFSDPKSHQLYTLTNVIASFGSHSKRILLCAHWDTRPWADNDPNPQNQNQPILGANDGASGVAVLLEIAHILKTNPSPIGVDIVLFDGEDSGIQGKPETWCQGSRFFAQSKCLTQIPLYGILLDFVGDKDLHFPVEVNSHRFAPEIVDLVWGRALELGLPAFDRSPGYEMIDDHLELLKVGIPAVDIIDFDYPYYHTLEDTEDKCSAESLGIVGTLLTHLIYEP